MILKIPFIGSWIKTYYISLYFKIVSVFLQEKIPLSQSLIYANSVISNKMLDSYPFLDPYLILVSFENRIRPSSHFESIFPLEESLRHPSCTSNLNTTWSELFSALALCISFARIILSGDRFMPHANHGMSRVYCSKNHVYGV